MFLRINDIIACRALFFIIAFYVGLWTIRIPTIKDQIQTDYLGIGYIFAQTIETVGRQPNAESRVAKYCWIGFALVEAIALYGLVVAFIIMGNI